MAKKPSAAALPDPVAGAAPPHRIKRLLVLVAQAPSEGNQYFLDQLLDLLMTHGKPYRAFVDKRTTMRLAVSRPQDFNDQALIVAVAFQHWGSDLNTNKLTFQRFGGAGGRGVSIEEWA